MRDLAGRRITWRSLPLILAGMVFGAALITPGVGLAAKFLTKKKADKRYLNSGEAYTRTEADTQFLTQAEADALFLTPAEGDARFLAKGEIILSQVGPWVGTNAEVEASVTGVTVTSTASAGSQFEALMQLLAPRRIGGQAHALKEVEVCYSLSDGSGDKIDDTIVADNRTGSGIPLVNHDTEGMATSPTCYTVGPGFPTVPQGSLTLRLAVVINSAGTDGIELRSVTTTWVPA